MPKNGQEKAERVWDDLTKQAREIILVFGGILFFPVILLVAAGYGVRAGIVETIERTLSIIKGCKP